MRESGKALIVGDPDHNHNKLLVWALSTGRVLKVEPGVQDLRVLHDDWCALLSTAGGRCNCEPEIQFGMDRVYWSQMKGAD